MRRVTMDRIAFGLAVGAGVINVQALVLNLFRMPHDPFGPSLWATWQVLGTAWMVILARRAWRFLLEHRQARRMDVRVLHSDGSMTRAELVNVGVWEGVTHWRVVEPAIGVEDQVFVGILPPMTAIDVRLKDDPGE